MASFYTRRSWSGRKQQSRNVSVKEGDPSLSDSGQSEDKESPVNESQLPPTSSGNTQSSPETPKGSKSKLHLQVDEDVSFSIPSEPKEKRQSGRKLSLSEKSGENYSSLCGTVFGWEPVVDLGLLANVKTESCENDAPDTSVSITRSGRRIGREAVKIDKELAESEDPSVAKTTKPRRGKSAERQRSSLLTKTMPSGHDRADSWNPVETPVLGGRGQHDEPILVSEDEVGDVPSVEDEPVAVGGNKRVRRSPRKVQNQSPELAEDLKRRRISRKKMAVSGSVGHKTVNDIADSNVMKDSSHIVECSGVRTRLTRTSIPDNVTSSPQARARTRKLSMTQVNIVSFAPKGKLKVMTPKGAGIPGKEDLNGVFLNSEGSSPEEASQSDEGTPLMKQKTANLEETVVCEDQNKVGLQCEEHNKVGLQCEDQSQVGLQHSDVCLEENDSVAESSVTVANDVSLKEHPLTMSTGSADCVESAKSRSRKPKKAKKKKERKTSLVEKVSENEETKAKTGADLENEESKLKTGVVLENAETKLQEIVVPESDIRTYDAFCTPGNDSTVSLDIDEILGCAGYDEPLMDSSLSTVSCEPSFEQQPKIDLTKKLVVKLQRLDAGVINQFQKDLFDKVNNNDVDDNSRDLNAKSQRAHSSSDNDCSSHESDDEQLFQRSTSKLSEMTVAEISSGKPQEVKRRDNCDDLPGADKPPKISKKNRTKTVTERAHDKHRSRSGKHKSSEKPAVVRADSREMLDGEESVMNTDGSLTVLGTITYLSGETPTGSLDFSGLVAEVVNEGDEKTLHDDESSVIDPCASGEENNQNRRKEIPQVCQGEKSILSAAETDHDTGFGNEVSCSGPEESSTCMESTGLSPCAKNTEAGRTPTKDTEDGVDIQERREHKSQKKSKKRKKDEELDEKSAKKHKKHKSDQSKEKSSERNVDKKSNKKDHKSHKSKSKNEDAPVNGSSDAKPKSQAEFNLAGFLFSQEQIKSQKAKKTSTVAPTFKKIKKISAEKVSDIKVSHYVSPLEKSANATAASYSYSQPRNPPSHPSTSVQTSANPKPSQQQQQMVGPPNTYEVPSHNRIPSFSLPFSQPREFAQKQRTAEQSQVPQKAQSALPSTISEPMPVFGELQPGHTNIPKKIDAFGQREKIDAPREDSAIFARMFQPYLNRNNQNPIWPTAAQCHSQSTDQTVCASKEAERYNPQLGGYKDASRNKASYTPTPISTLNKRNTSPVNRDPRLRGQKYTRPTFDLGTEDVSDYSDTELDRDVIYGLKGINKTGRPSFGPGFYTEVDRERNVCNERTNEMDNDEDLDADLFKSQSRDVAHTDDSNCDDRYLDSHGMDRFANEDEDSGALPILDESAEFATSTDSPLRDVQNMDEESNLQPAILDFLNGCVENDESDGLTVEERTGESKVVPESPSRARGSGEPQGSTNNEPSSPSVPRNEEPPDSQESRDDDDDDERSVELPSDSDDSLDEDDMDPRRRRYLGKSESVSRVRSPARSPARRQKVIRKLPEVKDKVEDKAKESDNGPMGINPVESCQENADNTEARETCDSPVKAPAPVSVARDNRPTEVRGTGDSPVEVSTKASKADDSPVGVSTEARGTGDSPVEVSTEARGTGDSPVEVSAEVGGTDDSPVEMSAPVAVACDNVASHPRESGSPNRSPSQSPSESDEMEYSGGEFSTGEEDSEMEWHASEPERFPESRSTDSYRAESYFTPSHNFRVERDFPGVMTSQYVPTPPQVESADEPRSFRPAVSHPALLRLPELIKEASRRNDIRRIACLYKLATIEEPLLEKEHLTAFASGLIRRVGSLLTPFITQLLLIRDKKQLTAEDHVNLSAIAKGHIDAFREKKNYASCVDLLKELRPILPWYTIKAKSLASIVERVYIAVDVLLHTQQPFTLMLQILEEGKWPRPAPNSGLATIVMRLRCLRRMWANIVLHLGRVNCMADNMRGEDERKRHVDTLVKIFRTLFLSRKIDDRALQMDSSLRDDPSLSEMYNMVLLGAVMVEQPGFLMKLCVCHCNHPEELPVNFDVASSVVRCLYQKYADTSDFQALKMATRIFPFAITPESKYSYFAPPTENGLSNVVVLPTSLQYWEIHLLIEAYFYLMSKIPRDDVFNVFPYNVRLLIVDRGVYDVKQTKIHVCKVVSKLFMPVRILTVGDGGMPLQLCAHDVKSYIATVWLSPIPFV